MKHGILEEIIVPVVRYHFTKRGFLVLQYINKKFMYAYQNSYNEGFENIIARNYNLCIFTLF